MASDRIGTESDTLIGKFDVIRHGLREPRDYQLFTPTSVRSDPRPLVVMLHGCRQQAAEFAAGTRMNELARRHRFRVLYPEQSPSANAFRCWNWFLPEQPAGEGEASAIAALIEGIALRYPVDRSRIYVAGLSAGGALTAQLALTHGVLFAACAIIAGLMHGAADSPAEALQAMHTGSRRSPTGIVEELVRGPDAALTYVPALILSGDRDTTVHPSNAEKLVAQFRRFAELSSRPSAPLDLVRNRVRHPPGGRRYRQEDYAHRGGILLRSIAIEGLGHAWSGGDAAYPFNDASPPETSALVWDFFSGFERLHGGDAQRRPRWKRLFDS
jgi:poly(hydroxyalkanoate) depolymerase family esterase